MGFFSIHKKEVSKASIYEWTSKDVAVWAKTCGIHKSCRTALKSINGKQLVGFSSADLVNCFKGRVRIENMQFFMDRLAKLKLDHGISPTHNGKLPTIARPVREHILQPQHSHANNSIANDSVATKPNAAVLSQEHTSQGSHSHSTSSTAHDSHSENNSQHAKHVPRYTSSAVPSNNDDSRRREVGNLPAYILSDTGHGEHVHPTPQSLRQNNLTYNKEQASRDAGHPTHHYIDDATTSDNETAYSVEPREPDYGSDGHLSTVCSSDEDSDFDSTDHATPQYMNAPAASRPGDVYLGQLQEISPARFAPPIDRAGSEAASTGTASSGVGSTAVPAAMQPVLMRPTHATNSDQGKPTSQLVGIHEQTAYLAEVMGDQISAQDLDTFLMPLERTRGLIDLVSQNPPSAGLLAAIYRTYDDCFHAVPCAQNAAHLQDFCLAVFQVLEASGKRGVEVPDTLIKELVDLFMQASELIVGFSTAGWFLHMAFMQNIKARFDGIHNAIVNKLTEGGLSTLPNGKSLSMGDYKDPARPVRRVLKQLGSGSVAKGIYEVTAKESCREKIANVMEVHRGDLAAELATVPQGDQAVDLQNLYDTLVAGRLQAKIDAADYEQHCSIFRWYDKGSKGYMDSSDLKQVLSDLGLLESVRDKDQFVTTQMAMATRHEQRALDIDDFCTYYCGLVHVGERHQIRTKLGIDAENELKHQFHSFANYGSRTQVMLEMDGARFQKYARDCKLLNRYNTPTEVDLIFAKIKAKNSRHIDFDRFLQGLTFIAEKRKQPFVDVVSHALKYEAPTTNGTTPENVRLHDDRSTYTGVYSRGGPTNLDLQNSNDLRHLTDRSAANARGVKLTPLTARMSLARTPTSMRAASDVGSGTSPSPLRTQSGAGSGAGAGPGTGAPTPRSMTGSRDGGVSEKLTTPGGPSGNYDRVTSPDLSNSRLSTPPRSPAPMNVELQRTFMAFAQFGKRLDPKMKARNVQIDGRTFAKVCKEADLLDHKLDMIRVDLTFTKCADKVTKRMSFKQFVDALCECARHKGVPSDVILDVVATCEGPLLQGTVAPEPVRLHDDRRTYTGVYAQGGPSNVDMPTTLEGLVDRQAQDYLNRRVGVETTGHRKAFAS